MCRTHVVWIKCGEIETETLGKAKAHLLPLVIPVISAWSLQSNCSILVSMLASAYMEASGCCRGVQPAAYSVCKGPSTQQAVSAHSVRSSLAMFEPALPALEYA